MIRGSHEKRARDVFQILVLREIVHGERNAEAGAR